ncbi:ThiF family adenylyltransferase [Botrimarina hoheduenensis]|uniref:Sulfur carrier protein ThiS adenylyltransferase n=1 Tax=Botrimarina hoheduenensis TaxID=2528000 RepID=A0A5C5VZ92_9BACT|nr:ThiF family adenylyltransferase [Botrimarina hoheduenensis]TWT43315.1 Sulfur carrier protein ThiS adenylyltransferase [Botrimarina hoheduenensis]
MNKPPTNDPPTDPPDRYAKQVRYAPIGAAGQQRLQASRVLVVGCGALGSVTAETLVRSGVGHVRLVDRDIVELSNLQRQVLYTEADAAAGSPKAIAAAERLRTINSTITIEPHVADVTHHNLPQLAAGVDLILDGTDNFATRLLLNDYAHATGTPWVYAGVIGAEGRVMPIVPGQTACLACLMPTLPAPGDTPTCDTAGVIGPAVNVVASVAVAEGIKWLVGASAKPLGELTVLDLWAGVWRRLRVPRAADCPVCQQGQYDWLAGRHAATFTLLCGQGAVQISPAADARPPDLAALRQRLEPLGEVSGNAFLLRCRFERWPLTLFADGRVIVGGVETEAEARTVLARCLGG